MHYKIRGRRRPILVRSEEIIFVISCHSFFNVELKVSHFLSSLFSLLILISLHFYFSSSLSRNSSLLISSLYFFFFGHEHLRTVLRDMR